MAAGEHRPDASGWPASSTPKGRPECWRVKHRLARNWVKVYDKVSVLRVETTINNPREFRVLRVFTDDRGRRERRWTRMNKGVANVWWRYYYYYYRVGMASNHRYLDALAAAPLKGEGVASTRRPVPEQDQNAAWHSVR